MSKFKIGDKVKIKKYIIDSVDKEYEQYKEYYNNTIFEIKSVDYNNYYVLKEDYFIESYWTEDTLELVESKENIILYLSEDELYDITNRTAFDCYVSYNVDNEGIAHCDINYNYPPEELIQVLNDIIGEPIVVKYGSYFGTVSTLRELGLC